MEVSSDSDSNYENFSELNSSATSYNVDNSKKRDFHKNSKQRNSLLLQTKRKILAYIDQHPEKSQKDIAEKFKVEFMVRRVEKQRVKLTSSYVTPSAKHIKSSDFPQVEEALLLWFKQLRSNLRFLDSDYILSLKQSELTTYFTKN